MRLVTIGVAIVLGGLVGNACLIDLEHRIACGDGYVDLAAGEECDPEDEDSFKNACQDIRPAGIGACDPIECTIIDTIEQCAKCGDGILDFEAGEECEANAIPTPCPTSGPVSCTSECKIDFSACDKCGNGVVDPGEECDPGDPGGIAIARPCAGGGDVPPLKSPYQDTPYTSGSTARCLDDCTYDRAECGYCGNGKLEKAGILVSLQPPITSRPELCEGEDFDLDKLAEQYNCPSDARANVECASNCLEVIELAGPECCLPKGADCPADGDVERCCHEYANPEPGTQHCSNPFLPPGEEPPPDTGGSKCN